ncbi:MAG TPA: flagellar biosynthesis protein FlhF [Candidatus Methylomirabilis sp.]|nr:flagellar biosynthesis protein FlhF [Candidatus Methylomirabilis sp.]
MRLRRFEAATVAEALSQVRADLGPEAVILHARSADPAAGRPGGRDRVMVTAAVDDDEPRAANREPRADRDGDRVRMSPACGYPDVATQGIPGCRGTAEGDGGVDWGSDEARDGDNRLEEIHRVLLELRAEAGISPTLPALLRPTYRRLMQAEVPPGVARQLLQALPAGTRVGRESQRVLALQRAAARAFRVGGPITPGQRQRVVALVGPTGVGKTTTVAKLAGQLRNAGGHRVALISLDTYRIGATAQMQIYAELLRVPLHVVRTPAEVQAAFRAERGRDLILVDTAGRSPGHPEGIAAIRSLLRPIPDLEVHLVVSATTKGSDAEEILRRFRPLSYGRLLLTKLDEARTAGPLLGLALRRGIPISYLTTGQEVPDDLEVATPRRLAALLVPETSKCRRTTAVSA